MSSKRAEERCIAKVKEHAITLLTKLCNQEVDLCLSIMCDKDMEIASAVESALLNTGKEKLPTYLDLLYDVINKYSIQFWNTLSDNGVIDATISACRTKVINTVKKHITYFVCNAL